MLARARCYTDRRVAMFAGQNLVEADGAVLERDRRAGQVQQPGSIRALAGDGAGLVRPLAQSRDPLPTGPRVVQPQALDVHDLEARALDLRQRLAESREIAVREDVAVQELGLAGAPPVKVVDDPVGQGETAALEPGAHAPAKSGVGREAAALGHAHRRDLLVTGR